MNLYLTCLYLRLEMLTLLEYSATGYRVPKSEQLSCCFGCVFLIGLPQLSLERMAPA